MLSSTFDREPAFETVAFLLLCLFRVEPRVGFSRGLDGGSIVLKRVQLGFRLTASEKDPTSEPPGGDLLELEGHVPAHGDGENVVQLFQATLLSLGHPQEHHGQRDQVESRIESKRPLRSHGLQHAWKSKRDDGGPKVVGGDRPRHSHLPMRERKHFG